ncbi:hypothetical protein I8748_05605 [Nostoc sp. CENA67]|uniref:Uncharacterized protein n=1 Tax=Amazonocrinis nigriterrae CENA67 TaxID=2794033 RepID=A0A8J7HSN3_9NOST|nr:hypothetical protein [Amazonocrinis nigriterrae]MBH8561659.1 hypothetical protein [Amazonocrinis nigriterrae CENA67]
MSENETVNKPSTNGKSSHSSATKSGKKRQWKDLPVDSLSKGFEIHQAEYVVGKSPVIWSTVTPGQLFSLSETGKNLHVKLSDARAISLDTRVSIEFKPSIRLSTQVWVVTSFNSITANFKGQPPQ